jgi:hypothetical protein
VPHIAPGERRYACKHPMLKLRIHHVGRASCAGDRAGIRSHCSTPREIAVKWRTPDRRAALATAMTRELPMFYFHGTIPARQLRRSRAGKSASQPRQA